MTGPWVSLSRTRYEDGSAVLDLTMSGLTIEPDGPTGVTAGTLTLTIAPDGRITTVKGTGASSGRGRRDAGYTRRARQSVGEPVPLPTVPR